MDLHFDARIPFPRDLVFRTYRDEIPKLVPYLPDVRSIELTSRKEDGSRIETVMIWRGGGDIPTAFRAVLSEAMLTWTDYATWDSTSMRCDWRTQTHALSEALLSQGSNAFLDDGPGKTLLELRGRFEIDGKKIRGVPGFLAGKVGKSIEEFLGGKIGANLTQTATAMARYLGEHAA